MRALLAAFVVMVVSLANGGVAMAQVAIAEGQVWTLKDAPSDAARVVIVRIEPYGDAEAVHVSIYGLPNNPPGFAGEIAHMPFDREALEASLGTLTSEAARTDLPFEGGYRQWKRAKGGIFTLSVTDAVGAVLGLPPPAAPPPPQRT